MNVKEILEETYRVTGSKDALLELIRDVSSDLHEVNGVKYRPPGLYEIKDFHHLFVLGDLHGDLETFIEFLHVSKILEMLRNGVDVKLLLLGDYIDRGSRQLELITMLLYMKKTFPDNILLLRGNHEPPLLLIPYPHDFYDILHFRFGEDSDEVYRGFFSLFQRLAYCARLPGKILFLHGGPPSTVLKYNSFEEAFSIGKPLPDDSVLEEILWNDPVEHSQTPVEPSPRGAGVLFNSDLTKRTLELANVKYIVRGHEPVEGFKFNHGKRVVTIFDSRIEAYGITKASYIHINTDRSFNDNIEDFITMF